MRDGCAYCSQTKAYITNKGGTYKEVNMTDSPDLGHRVATAAHSSNVPVVTTADTPEAIESGNFYVGWKLQELNRMIEQEKE